MKHRDRAVTRRTGGEYRRIRPAFVYALGALVALLAGEAMTWQRDASAADDSSRRARVVKRRARPTRGEDAGFGAPLGWYESPTAGQLARPPAPEAADEQAEEREQEEGTLIAAEDWKLPPPPNPDPSARPAIDDVWPNKGPDAGGEKVQIRGRNLQPVYVLFGRTPAKIVGVDEAGGNVTLTVVVPPRTGQGREWIVVANRDGSNATSQFEYYR